MTRTRTPDAVAVIEAVTADAPDRKSAINQLTERLRLDKALLDLMQDYCFSDYPHFVARRAIGSFQADSRRLVRMVMDQYQIEPQTIADVERLAERTERFLDRMSTWTLPSGAVLITASGRQVREAAIYHQKLERGNHVAGRFYELIASEVHEDQMVGEALTTEGLIDLLRVAQQEGQA